MKVIILPPKKGAEGEEKKKAAPAPALELKTDPGKG